MGAYLQTLKRFRVSTELTGELADGQKLQHTATADLDVDRPNQIRAWMHSARSDRELFYDGATVALYTPAQKFYSTVEFSGTIGDLIGRSSRLPATEEGAGEAGEAAEAAEPRRPRAAPPW